MNSYILNFGEIEASDLSKVGRKNMLLGEMFRYLRKAGINIPDGFAITTEAFWYFLDHNNFRKALADILRQVDSNNFHNLREVGARVRLLLSGGDLPYELQVHILAANRFLQDRLHKSAEVALRLSRVPIDLLHHAGSHSRADLLNIRGDDHLLNNCLLCYSNFFSDRFIRYAILHGQPLTDAALSIGVQQMIRSDLACSGLACSLGGHHNLGQVILIKGSWGLVENVITGRVSPDQFIVSGAGLEEGGPVSIARRLGEKERTLIFSRPNGTPRQVNTVNTSTPPAKRRKLILSDAEVETLARWVLAVEHHFGRAMELEWAKDGMDQRLYLIRIYPKPWSRSRPKASVQSYFSL